MATCSLKPAIKERHSGCCFWNGDYGAHSGFYYYYFIWMLYSQNFAPVKNEKKKKYREIIAIKRISKPAYYLTFTNHCTEWAWLLDYLPQKLQKLSDAATSFPTQYGYGVRGNDTCTDLLCPKEIHFCLLGLRCCWRFLGHPGYGDFKCCIIKQLDLFQFLEYISPLIQEAFQFFSSVLSLISFFWLQP